jgi:hypothetical protein
MQEIAMAANTIPLPSGASASRTYVEAAEEDPRRGQPIWPADGTPDHLEQRMAIQPTWMMVVMLLCASVAVERP